MRKNACDKIYINEVLTHERRKIECDLSQVQGESDLRIGDKTLLEIKCGRNSNAEWLLQLLLYAALYKIYLDITIETLLIYNVREGMVYFYDISGFCKHRELIEYCEKEMREA
jgi:hypothetical protein